MTALVPLQLRFSHEELVVLLELQELPMIAGVGQNPFGDLTENIQTLLKQVALRSLLARNIVTINADGIATADEHLSKILFFCAHPLELITMIWQEEDVIHTEYVYQVPELSIVHGQIYPGVHELILFEDNTASFIEKVLDRVQCETETALSESFTLARSDFDRIHDMAGALTQSELKNLLIFMSVDEQIAGLYAASLVSGGIKLLIESKNFRDNNRKEYEMTVLATSQGCWLMKGLANPGSRSIIIAPASLNEIKNKLEPVFAE